MDVVPSLPPPQHPPRQRRPGRTFSTFSTSRGGVNRHHARAQGKSTPRTCTAATVGPSVDSAATPHTSPRTPRPAGSTARTPPTSPRTPSAADTLARRVCWSHVPPREVAPGNAVPDAHQPQTNRQGQRKGRCHTAYKHKGRARTCHAATTTPSTQRRHRVPEALSARTTHVRCTHRHTQHGHSRWVLHGKGPVPAPPPPCTPRRRP